VQLCSSIIGAAPAPNPTVIVDETVDDGDAGNDEANEEDHLKPLRQAFKPLLRENIERYQSANDTPRCEN
jgi:hypothetical protein